MEVVLDTRIKKHKEIQMIQVKHDPPPHTHTKRKRGGKQSSQKKTPNKIWEERRTEQQYLLGFTRMSVNS